LDVLDARRDIRARIRQLVCSGGRSALLQHINSLSAMPPRRVGACGTCFASHSGGRRPVPGEGSSGGVVTAAGAWRAGGGAARFLPLLLTCACLLRIAWAGGLMCTTVYTSLPHMWYNGIRTGADVLDMAKAGDCQDGGVAAAA